MDFFPNQNCCEAQGKVKGSGVSTVKQKSLKDTSVFSL